MSTVVSVFFSLVFFVGGLYLFGVAYQVPESWAAVTFFSGILAVCVAVSIPAHVISNNDRV